MPAYCEPWPENRKARRRPSHFSATSGLATSSDSARCRCSSEPARTHARSEKWVRPLLMVNDRSRALRSGDRAINEQHCSIDAASADRVLPENGNGRSGGPSAPSPASGGGASSSTAKAFVPPSPSEFTAANLGPLSRGQSRQDRLTKNGLSSKLIF